MIKHTMSAITLGFILFFLYLFQYTGAFKTVTLARDSRGPFTLIYLEHTGAYHKIVERIQQVEKWALENGLKCRLSFGEYFDDPRLVEEGRLTSRGGCLVDPLAPEEMRIFEKIKNQTPPEFKISTIEKTDAVVALFTGAPGIGPMKVYPKAEEFIQDNNLVKKGSVIEIYEIFDKRAMQTTYIWPVSNKSAAK